MFDIAQVRQLASSYGWAEVQYNPVSRVIGFVRGEQRVNVYYTTGTVGTCVDHPRRGRTQLFRRGQSFGELRQTFQDPRVHTGAGYYRRHSAQRPEPSQAGYSGGIWCCLSDSRTQKDLLRYWSSSAQTLALGSGCFAVERDGSTWWSDVPKALDDKLRGRQAWLPAVDNVALGPDDRYFVQFCDGDWQTNGPDSLCKALREAGAAVEVLAFAPDGGWYALWEDGSYAWEGLPRSLHNQLNGRQKCLPGVEDLSMGPNGEWFVRFLDGSWRSFGLQRDPW